MSHFYSFGENRDLDREGHSTRPFLPGVPIFSHMTLSNCPYIVLISKSPREKNSSPTMTSTQGEKLNGISWIGKVLLA